MILSRISEQEIGLWMAAKCHQLRESGLGTLNNFQASIDLRSFRRAEEPYYDVSWTMHAVEALALSHDSIRSAELEIRTLIADDPEKKSRDKKAQARRLLEEAEQLDAMAVKLTEAAGH